MPVNDMDKIKPGIMAGWLIALLVAILGYNYLKDIIVFFLTRLYQFFIQNPQSKTG